MKTRCLFAAGFALSICAVAPAYGTGAVVVSQVANGGGSDLGGGNFANTVTNDIHINAPPGLQIGAMQIRLELTSGHIIEHPFGSNSAPNSAMVAAFPTLAFDSFLAGGFAMNEPGNHSGASLILGPSLELGRGTIRPMAASFTASTYDVSYGAPLGQPNAGATNYLAARLTLSDDAVGTLSFKVDFGNSALGHLGSAGFYPLGLEPSVVPIAGGVIAPISGLFNTLPEPISQPVEVVLPPTLPPTLPSPPPISALPASPPPTAPIAPGAGSDPVDTPIDGEIIIGLMPDSPDLIEQKLVFDLDTTIWIPGLDLIETIGDYPILVDRASIEGARIDVTTEINYWGERVGEAIWFGKPDGLVTFLKSGRSEVIRFSSAPMLFNSMFNDAHTDMAFDQASNATFSLGAAEVPEPTSAFLLAAALFCFATCVRRRGVR